MGLDCAWKDMKRFFLSAAMLTAVLVPLEAQFFGFGQGGFCAPRSAVSITWAGNPSVQINAGGGGWGYGYARPCVPYYQPVVPVWSGACFSAPVLNYYYGASPRGSSRFVVPRRYGAAPIVADPVFRPAAPFYPVRGVRVAR